MLHSLGLHHSIFYLAKVFFVTVGISLCLCLLPYIPETSETISYQVCEVRIGS